MSVTTGAVTGQRLAARYRLDWLIEDRPGASVWRAEDTELGRPLMAWVLPPHTPVPVGVIAAMLGSAPITDERVARIVDADCDAAHPYVVAEWPSGQRIDQIVASGLPGLATVTAIVTAAADIVAAAHAVGQPHLRLTPGSVLWGPAGVTITGFGVEAALAGVGMDATAPIPHPSAAGVVSVPPALAATDTRALAGLLYALLTGYWPGEAPSALPPAPRAGGAVRPPRELRPEVSWALDMVASCALSAHRDPATLSPAHFAAEVRAARRAAG